MKNQYSVQYLYIFDCKVVSIAKSELKCLFKEVPSKIITYHRPHSSYGNAIVLLYMSVTFSIPISSDLRPIPGLYADIPDFYSEICYFVCDTSTIPKIGIVDV